MAISGLEELLSDAQLVLTYAVRAGRLPDDALPNAIAAIEGASPGDAVSKIAPLAAALNAVVRAIAPMTLVDLRAGRSPFDTPRRNTRHLQIAVGVFTLLMIGSVAYFTQVLHQEDMALQALQRIQDARPLEKLNNARKMAQKEGVLGKQDSQYDQYQRSVAELRDLQDKVAGAHQLANAIMQRPSFPLAWALSTLPIGTAPSANGPAKMPGPAVAEARPPASDVPGAPAMPVTAPSPNDEAPDPVAALKGACVDFEKTAAPVQANLSVDAATQALGARAWLCRVLLDVSDEFRFSTMLGLGFYSYSLPPTSSLTYQIQADMAALNGWILPLLYGLLGATVFLMRNILDTRTPHIEVFSSILRIALGGIAGIVIGWFWAPGPSKTAELAAITSAPFALAFLVGFSIDILFSLLDRLNRVASASPGVPSAVPGVPPANA
jgi:hypothetical protein